MENGADLEKRAGDRHTALTYAVLRERESIVSYLLEAGANPNRTGYNYEAPLLMASRLGAYDIAKMLLAAGADIDESDSTGRVALDWAREMRHRDIAALLEAAERD